MAKQKKTLKDYSSLSSMSAKWVLSNLPFVLFLSFLITIYIANRHYSEKNIREIQSLKNDVKQLRRHYLSEKSLLMKESKQSQVAKEVKEIGLSNKGKHPIKINID